jgi:hypothetical protein
MPRTKLLTIAVSPIAVFSRPANAYSSPYSQTDPAPSGGVGFPKNILTIRYLAGVRLRNPQLSIEGHVDWE